MSLSSIGNNDRVLGDVLHFLDTNSRQRLRMQSSRLNALIAADSTAFNVQLEMVQIRGNSSNSSAVFNCKVLPPLVRRSCILLMNIQYIDLNPHNLQQLNRLVECSIRDISITGCNFFECTQEAFMEVFMRGALRSARYNIACVKNLRADVFDDRFISSLPALDVKMLTINFCSFADADTDAPTRYLQISDSYLLDWILVDAVGPQEQRNLSLTDMNLGRDFAARAHEVSSWESSEGAV
ncbi:hypothetical protein M3Y99_00451900 [Aphelenchoides fujianensis]|nr:hypothetical protein M3Y99_00451900 [Aphelenchoides fujianensis]